MTMAKSKEIQIFIGIDDQVIELTGADKETFIVERNLKIERTTQFQTQQLAKQDARESALKKLADIAGLTKEELASIL
jgi:hypothetical protein